MAAKLRTPDLTERRARALEWFLIGDRHREARDPHRALKAYWKGLRIHADSPQALLNTASLFLSVRQIDDSLDLLRAATEAFPEFLPLRSSLFLASLYSAETPPLATAQTFLAWGRHAAPPKPGPRPRPAIRSGERIRIGYLSPYFAANPEIYFSTPLIKAHDRDKFKIYLYSAAQIEDHYTDNFRSIADVFRPIAGLPDEEASALIRRDRIQILVDLCGHFSGNRIGVFISKPAPVAVSFPTWPATTGLPAIDYRIGDTITDPGRQAARLYSEKLVRLRRSYCCYEPPGEPAVPPLPARANGFVTFGVFNRPQKLNDHFLRMCAAVLRQVPDSRVLFHHSYNGPRRVLAAYRKPMEKVFEQAGVDPRRLDFIGARPTQDHLSTLAAADIALDSFPYNGMTTTCESLWMGVPVVTLAGGSHVSRVGASLLSAVGLAGWVAATPDEYVRIAAAKASNVVALDELRRTLRPRMARSPLTDAQGYARSVERLYERMWSNYVGSLAGYRNRRR